MRLEYGLLRAIYFFFFFFPFLLSFHAFSFQYRTSTLITTQMKIFMQQKQKTYATTDLLGFLFFLFFQLIFLLFAFSVARGNGGRRAKSVPSTDLAGLGKAKKKKKSSLRQILRSVVAFFLFAQTSNTLKTSPIPSSSPFYPLHPGLL